MIIKLTKTDLYLLTTLNCLPGLYAILVNK